MSGGEKNKPTFQKRLRLFAEKVALGWWVFALGVTNLFTRNLPWEYSREVSCILGKDWFVYVDCGSSWGNQLLGHLLSFALYWTKEVHVLVLLSAVPAFLPLGLLWIASTIFALSGLVRLISRTVHS
jgi:hypothetical protein